MLPFLLFVSLVMAFIGIEVPPEVAVALEQISVPGVKEPRDHYHITLLHLGSEIPIENVSRAGLATFLSCSSFAPFETAIGHIESFPQGDDGFPIVARIISTGIHRLQSFMVSTFDRLGIDFSKKFPEYKPHVTLSYADRPIQPRLIVPTRWTVRQVVVWGGDKGANRMVVKVPLEHLEDKATSLRVAARHQRGPLRTPV